MDFEAWHGISQGKSIYVRHIPQTDDILTTM